MKKTELPSKELVITHMKNGIANFKFEKKDGTIREMNATLNSSQIDSRYHKETNPNPHDANPDLVVCWDVEAKGWRSFNISTLQEYNGAVRNV